LSYCDSDLVGIGNLILQSYQIVVITLSVIGEIICWWSYDVFKVYRSW